MSLAQYGVLLKIFFAWQIFKSMTNIKEFEDFSIGKKLMKACLDHIGFC